MKTKLFFLAAILFVAACTEDKKLPYKIEKQELNEYLKKATFDIRLEKELERLEIREIAKTIKKENPDFNTYFISYYLPEMKIGSGAWATSHFNPDLEVKIHGIKKKEVNKLKSIEMPEGEIIGKWIDNRPYAESTIIIFKQKNQLYYRQGFKDGSYGDEKLKLKNNKYIYDNDFGEYFKIESDGNLGWYSSNGRFALAKRLK
jgi:hypothetical protein